MNRLYKSTILIFLINIFFCVPSNSHVQHYENLKRIEFDIYRNNKQIGKHIFSFERDGSKLSVKSKINFEIKKLNIVLYKYLAEGIEIFENGKLVQFNSKTQQNKKEKYVFLCVYYFYKYQILYVLNFRNAAHVNLKIYETMCLLKK